MLKYVLYQQIDERWYDSNCINNNKDNYNYFNCCCVPSLPMKWSDDVKCMLAGSNEICNMHFKQSKMLLKLSRFKDHFNSNSVLSTISTTWRYLVWYFFSLCILEVNQLCEVNYHTVRGLQCLQLLFLHYYISPYCSIVCWTLVFRGIEISSIVVRK